MKCRCPQRILKNILKQIGPKNKESIKLNKIRWKLIYYWKRLRYDKNDKADKIMNIVYNHKECTWWIDNRLDVDRVTLGNC